ncbi:MAG TPA: type IV pilus secretin PilQ, partial [Thermoanaerobaculia bacterium]|nr:type IV pilus secretin PilQ [Thermoanaerobaculia bacterium]
IASAERPAPPAASAAAPAPVAPSPAANPPAEKPAPVEARKESPKTSIELPKEPVKTAETRPAPDPAKDDAAANAGLTKYATGPSVESIPVNRRAHGVLEARKMPRAAKPVEAAAAAPAAAKAAAPKGSSEDPLFESAEVMLDQQEKPVDKQELANTYKSRTVGGGETQYTGEPISLDLKDADIKDVFRTISELTGLNIVIDPDVRGTVTVRLENVPWDQALELILKQNGLGYIIENNVMRIATTGKLQREEQERAALDLARQASLPTKTVIKRLSYANVGQAAATLKRVMSPRGDVIVDERTNTLIIREIQDYMPTVLQLLENLDRPTEQVIIESRIVETTKTFGHTLGVNWGFSGVADAAHGNTTNLVFPNNGNLAGTVFTRPNGAAQPSATGLALRLGNVLDTFNLDIALNAAENQGLVKIISSPRVAAMTNESASIQTGLQIPVQTTVNNTTSVLYVDATLQLQVTPQITAEGTILMQVNIQKREPAPGVQIQGGGNVPLSIRQARTKIIVKDGGTAVIGGIFQMNDNDSYNYVPGLGKIPIIGNLFRTKQRLENHDELLIFITPRIIH